MSATASQSKSVAWLKIPVTAMTEFTIGLLGISHVHSSHSAATSRNVALQVVPAGQEPWSLLQRSAAVGRNGAKLLGVGFGASLFGVSITNVLIEVSAARGLLWRPSCKPRPSSGDFVFWHLPTDTL